MLFNLAPIIETVDLNVLVIPILSILEINLIILIERRMV